MWLSPSGGVPPTTVCSLLPHGLQMVSLASRQLRLCFFTFLEKVGSTLVNSQVIALQLTRRGWAGAHEFCLTLLPLPEFLNCFATLWRATHLDWLIPESSRIVFTFSSLINHGSCSHSIFYTIHCVMSLPAYLNYRGYDDPVPLLKPTIEVWVRNVKMSSCTDWIFISFMAASQALLVFDETFHRNLRLNVLA